jgi:phage portal protein BeeE
MAEINRAEEMSDTTFGISNKWWTSFGSWFGFGSLPGNGNPETGIQKSAGGGYVEAEIAVTDERAMQVSTVWSCVRLIVETVGSLPLDFKRVTSGGERVPLEPEHYIIQMLKHRPNLMMNALEFREAKVACLTLWGNFYAFIDWDGDRIVSLTPLRPDLMKVERIAGELTYIYSHERAAARRAGVVQLARR